MIVLYYQTKTPIGFWCRRTLNPKSLIQTSETLPVELIKTHIYHCIQVRYLKSIILFDRKMS